MPETTLDPTDRRILAVLQDNARISNADLAREVALSPSPCLRRVRELEEQGVIRRYAALLEPQAVGLPVSVFVNVTLERQIESALEVFEAAIAKRPGGDGVLSDDRRCGLSAACRGRRSFGL